MVKPYTPATGEWTVTGTLTAVNAALAALSFMPVANGFADTSAFVSISDGAAPAITGTLVFNGTAVNDAPVLNAPTAINYTDTIFDDTFAPIAGSLVANDVETNALTYGIAGGVDNGDGTISKRGAYGELKVFKASGAYNFTPDDTAIESLTIKAITHFTVTASDGVLTGNNTLDIKIGQSGITESIRDDVLIGTLGNDKFDGLAGNDMINGRAGADILMGGAGADTLDGGAGADVMTGGLGNDVYVVDDVGDVVTETSGLAAGIDKVNSSISYTLKDNVENLTLTGVALNGTGNTLNNVLIGNKNANTLNGDAGSDTLNGGAEADNLYA